MKKLFTMALLLESETSKLATSKKMQYCNLILDSVFAFVSLFSMDVSYGSGSRG